MSKHHKPASEARSSVRRPVYPVLAGLLLLIGLGAWWFVKGGTGALLDGAPAQANAQPASLVDERTCAGCHAQQVRDWRASHHRLAMQDATETSVQGNFDDARFQDDAGAARFFRRDGAFWVNAPGADGKPADFRVAYTFGVAPLQQYLVEGSGGRLQALDLAWDVNQRSWFRPPASQGPQAGDAQHWARPQQNANAQCVECHSTGFQRHYDPATDHYASRWNSLGVGCQACHGPASRHLDWAAKQYRAANAGFALDLARADRIRAVETCARCHARRVPLDDDSHHGQRLMDDYLPSTLTRELYELDGKIKGEVYEYGAFTQSRLYAKGVRCSDCHNPHSTALRAPGNGVCLRCHNPSGQAEVEGIDDRGLTAKNYDSPEHHHHAQGQAGSQCVDCHMPGKTFMGNDVRHDHGFSLPNPARALKLGTPDACLGCHREQPGDQVAEQFRLWYGEDKATAPRYDESLWLIRQGRPGASRALFQQLESRELPAIRRATLLAELPTYPSERALNAAARHLTHPAPQVRETAVRAVAALVPPEQRRNLLAPLLTDPVRAVRIAAAHELLGLRATGLGNYEQSWNEAIAEYEAVLLSQQDRAEANLNLARLYQANGRADAVEARLRTALRRDPDYLPARVALVQWLDGNFRWEEGRALLEQALTEHPRAALLRHANGLMLLRKGDLPGALEAFAEAVRLEPDNPLYGYAYAVAQHDSGQLEEAGHRLEALLERDPANREARLALIRYWREAGQIQKVQALFAELEQQNPDDPALRRE
ncbi:tetratricopeptide repeat protein [Pseudomonas sp. Q1-7]|uniref:tetratricopeptide repeat protein n=1 Tax=Pseudomonas sp. Q1-7 TaxID=3020843 RepID=UPI0023009971|nr:tetratricopeptide repeat protein [Pseudomonas sp. Q1-7]